MCVRVRAYKPVRARAKRAKSHLAYLHSSESEPVIVAQGVGQKVFSLSSPYTSNYC